MCLVHRHHDVGANDSSGLRPDTLNTSRSQIKICQRSPFRNRQTLNRGVPLAPVGSDLVIDDIAD